MGIRDSLSPSQLLGQTLGPAYRLIALLDASGHSFAFRAWDHAADRYVVVKVGRRSANAGTLGTFSTEASLAECDPDGIVPVIDHGIHGLQPFVVLPYLAGGALRQRRPAENGQPRLAHPALLHAWLPSVAAALDALHERGLAHGALSPDTILFDASQQPWLACFRIAAAIRPAHPEVEDCAVLQPDDSTDRFLFHCPQQLFGLAPSPAGDQFSLAAIVYDYLAAQPPFAGATLAAVAAAQAAHDIVPIELLSPKLPPSLCKALHRGLAHNPRKRHASCREFAGRVLEHVPAVDIPRKIRLLCPSCGTLATIEPAAAGHIGACIACRTQVEVHQELRWLALPADRRADLPVPGAEKPVAALRRRWLPVAIASLAASVAAALLLLRSPEPQPPTPPDALEDAAAAPAVAAAAEPAVAAAERVVAPTASHPAAEPEPIPVTVEPPAAPPAEPSAVIVAAPPELPVAAPPAAQAKPPANAAHPPADPPRPIVRDIAIDRLHKDLEGFHAARLELVAARKEQQDKIRAFDATLLNLAKERQAKLEELNRQIAARDQLLAQQGIDPRLVVGQQLFAQARMLDGQVGLLRSRVLEIEDEAQGITGAIASANGEISQINTQGEQVRRDWIARLNPLERDPLLAQKIETLSAEILESPDFMECRLYRALLHILAGNRHDARTDLAVLDGTLVNGPEPLLGSTAIDFVYANLMVGNGLAARRCLATAQKHAPNDPTLQHIQALCEIEENNFTSAAKLLQAALRTSKRRPPRDRILLCSDAAWLFAACPNDAVRNPKLAADNAKEAITTAPGKAWQAWRAKAVLDAEAGHWEAAKESVETARRTAPLILTKELDAQFAAIDAKQPYRIARK